jgi:hypothetical protein
MDKLKKKVMSVSHIPSSEPLELTSQELLVQFVLNQTCDQLEYVSPQSCHYEASMLLFSVICVFSNTTGPFCTHGSSICPAEWEWCQCLGWRCRNHCINTIPVTRNSCKEQAQYRQISYTFLVLTIFSLLKNVSPFVTHMHEK